MKNYKTILEQIKANRETIEAKTTEIENLTFIEIRRAEAANGNFETVKAYREEARKNEEKIATLCEEIEVLKIVNCILTENANHARTAEALPIIAEAFGKYNGKKYGEKTREKIRETLRAAGYMAYFEYGYKLNFEELVNGYTHCNSLIVYGNYKNPVITEENTINVDGFQEIRNPFTYNENPEQTAEAIKAKADEVRKIFEEAAKVAGEYNNMIVKGLRAAEAPKFTKIL